jgi:hypothetical protein
VTASGGNCSTTCLSGFNLTAGSSLQISCSLGNWSTPTGICISAGELLLHNELANITWCWFSVCRGIARQSVLVVDALGDASALRACHWLPKLAMLPSCNINVTCGGRAVTVQPNWQLIVL